MRSEDRGGESVPPIGDSVPPIGDSVPPIPSVRGESVPPIGEFVVVSSSSSAPASTADGGALWRREGEEDSPLVSFLFSFIPALSAVPSDALVLVRSDALFLVRPG